MNTNTVRDIMRRYHLTEMLRVVVGCVFIFSAATKGVDPYGTVLKIGEYFAAFGVPILEPAAPVFAVGLVALEMALGVALVVAAWPRITIVATFVVSLLFALLTLVLAVWNPVSDCGCFGDVVVMTNWQTFAKNVALVALLLVLGWGYDIWGEPRKVVGWRPGRVVAPLITLLTIGLTIDALVSLPRIDLSPFAVGVDLRKAMAEEQTDQTEVRVVCRHKGDGHEEEFAADDSRWWNTDEWEFVRTVENAPQGDRVEVRAKDFGLYDEAGDATAEVLGSEGAVSLVCVQNLWKLSPEQCEALRGATERAAARGDRVVVAVATPLKRATVKLAKLGFEVESLEVYNMDITTMQMVLRAPAGVVEIVDGVVAGKSSVYRLAK